MLVFLYTDSFMYEITKVLLYTVNLNKIMNRICKTNLILFVNLNEKITD